MKTKKKQTTNRTREWVKSWRMRRESAGSFKFLTEELRLEDKNAYRQYIRMDEKCFNILLDYIKSDIQKQNTILRLCIPPEEVLALVLRYLASGESYRSLEYLTRLSLGFISETIPYVCRIIYEKIKADYLKFPASVNEWHEIADAFNTRWQFPLCLGALDGKHVSFRASKKNGALYHNYKGFDSIDLLPLPDANYNIIYVDIGRNGRISDGGVLNRSTLRSVIEQSEKYLPTRCNDWKLEVSTALHNWR